MTSPQRNNLSRRLRNTFDDKWERGTKEAPEVWRDPLLKQKVNHLPVEDYDPEKGLRV